MKKTLICSMVMCMLMMVASVKPCYAENEKLFDEEVIFRQETSHADGTKNVEEGIPLKNWYNWFTLGGDGLADMQEALAHDGAKLYVKYKGDYLLSASYTHWGSVSGVGCSSVLEKEGYKYAVFDNDAVKKIRADYEANKANKSDDETIKEPNALSLDGRENEDKCDVVYGLYVTVSGKTLDNDGKVVIDSSKTYQTIDGFGASYTWYSDFLPGVKCAETGYDWIFNEAQFNILRFRDQNGLASNEKNEPINGYKKYKAYYDAAVKRGIKPIVMVTSWGQYDRTLPFVTYNEKSEKGYSYYTLAKDADGNYMYKELADFCVQSVQYFIDAGIPVDYFSIANEIELQERHVDETGKKREEAGFFFGQEETNDYCAYWRAHLAVYDAFRKAYGDKAPSIIGAETMGGDKKLLQAYLDKLIDTKADSLDVVAHHLYGTTLSSANFNNILSGFAQYRLWQTEWYTNNYSQLGDVILNELISENISAFLYWDGVWIEDKGNCLIEISSNKPDATIQRMPGHYIMTHFSRFIHRGYRRVDVVENLTSKVGAFKAEDGSKLVVVISNSSNREENLTLNISDYKSSKVYQSLVNKGSYMTDTGEYAERMIIPAKSLTTIEFDISSSEIVTKQEDTTIENVEIVEESSTFDVYKIVLPAVGIVLIIVGCIVYVFLKKKLNKNSKH